MWNQTKIDGAASSLLDIFLHDTADWRDDHNPAQAALIFGLCEHMTTHGDAEGLEGVGDRLITWMQSDGPRTLEGSRLLLRLTYRAFSKAFDCSGSDRRVILAAKISSLQGLMMKFDLEEAGAKKSDELQKNIQDAFKTAAEACVASLGGTPPPTDGAKGEWKAGKLRELMALALDARSHDIHLATAVCGWVREHASDFAVQVADRSLVQDVAGIEADFLERAAELEAQMGLRWSSLMLLEQAAFATAYQTNDLDRTHRLARSAIDKGDALLTTLDERSSGVTGTRGGLLERLYRLSRLTSDSEEIIRRLEFVCEYVRVKGRKHEQAQEWLEAADAYSNLGYRFFCEAEYTRLRRLYLLAVYFFEKSESLRAKAEGGGYQSIDPDEPNAPEIGYRRHEADGFIFGASAKIANGKQAIDLYGSAAQAHARAAKMVFGQTGLHFFYNSAAHYFSAQGSFQRAANSNEIAEMAALLSEAATALHECFRMFKQVFKYYEQTLDRMLSGETDPCPDEIARQLKRLHHPEAAALQSTSRSLSSFISAGDVLSAQKAIGDLSNLMVFINPMG